MQSPSFLSETKRIDVHVIPWNSLFRQWAASRGQANWTLRRLPGSLLSHQEGWLSYLEATSFHYYPLCLDFLSTVKYYWLLIWAPKTMGPLRVSPLGCSLLPDTRQWVLLWGIFVSRKLRSSIGVLSLFIKRIWELTQKRFQEHFLLEFKKRNPKAGTLLKWRIFYVFSYPYAFIWPIFPFDYLFST